MVTASARLALGDFEQLLHQPCLLDSVEPPLDVRNAKSSPLFESEIGFAPEYGMRSACCGPDSVDALLDLFSDWLRSFLRGEEVFVVNGVVVHAAPPWHSPTA